MKMNRNLYKKELKRNRKNLIIWTSIVLVFTILVLSIFPYMKNIGDQMAKMMSELPEGMTMAMGIDAQTFNSILGMYNTYYGIYIVVLLSIYAASTAAIILSKEERDKTAEFLLTKPISRKEIFVSKFFVLFTLVSIAYLVQTIIAVVFITMFGGDDMMWPVFITMHTHGLILILFFTCVCLFISMLLKPKKSYMGLTVGIVFGSYFLDKIAKATDVMDWIGYISPFRYLNFSVSDPNYGVHIIAVFLSLLVSIILIILSNKLYSKKDIAT